MQWLLRSPNRKEVYEDEEGLFATVTVTHSGNKTTDQHQNQTLILTQHGLQCINPFFIVLLHLRTDPNLRIPNMTNFWPIIYQEYASLAQNSSSYSDNWVRTMIFNKLFRNPTWEHLHKICSQSMQPFGEVKNIKHSTQQQEWTLNHHYSNNNNSDICPSRMTYNIYHLQNLF